MRPKCGRLVGFNAGDYHGVLPVLKGRRCALATWYTLQGGAREPGHAVAQEILGELEKEALQNVISSKDNAETLKRYQKDYGYHVVKTEKDLNGPQRFAADGLASKEECEQLIRLANVSITFLLFDLKG